MISDLPLSEDQINSDRFMRHANFLFSTLPHGHDPWETKMVNENQNLRRYRNKYDLPSKGVIFHTGHMSIYSCFDSLPETGSYILISRNRDYSLTEHMVQSMPKSIKKFYTINTPFKTNIIEPIPVGCATSGGYSGLLPIITKENIEKRNDKLIYCRLTLTKTEAGKERRDLIDLNKDNPIFTMQMNAVNADEMYRQMKSHLFTACPAGEGKDCLRTYETIIMGSIPIWSDCPELRHFEDLPVVYTKDWNLTREWCDNALRELQARKTSTDRMRMSYWDAHVQQSIRELL